MLIIRVSWVWPTGSHTAGRGDSVRPPAPGVPPRLQAPGEAQDRPHPLHDGVVHVCLFQNPALGLSASCLGHDPL